MNEVTTTQANALADVPQNYIAGMLEATRRKFLEINAGMDLDFVRIAQWIKMNKKGDFVLRNDEDTNFGDTLDVIIAQGEQRHLLWGLKASPEEGELLVAEKTSEEAERILEAWLESSPERRERYSIDDIKLCYLAYVVLVSTLTPEDMPEIYIISFPETGTISYGQYAALLMRGIKSKGIPKWTGIAQVVTRIGTETKKGKSNDEYLAYTFEAVGMFKPEEFGIKVE